MLAGPVPRTKTTMFNEPRDPEATDTLSLSRAATCSKVGLRFCPLVRYIMTSRELSARTVVRAER
jgi:hypothetical protein